MWKAPKVCKVNFLQGWFLEIVVISQIPGQKAAILMSNFTIVQAICMVKTAKCWQTYPLLTSNDILTSLSYSNNIYYYGKATIENKFMPILNNFLCKKTYQ